MVEVVVVVLTVEIVLAVNSVAGKTVVVVDMANVVVDIVVCLENSVTDNVKRLVNLVLSVVVFVVEVGMVTIVTVIDTVRIVVVDTGMRLAVDMEIVVGFDTVNLDSDSLMNYSLNPEILAVCTGHNRN